MFRCSLIGCTSLGLTLAPTPRTRLLAQKHCSRGMTERCIFKCYWKNTSRYLSLEKGADSIQFCQDANEQHYLLPAFIHTQLKADHWWVALLCLAHSLAAETLLASNKTFCMSALTAAGQISAQKGGLHIPSKDSVTQCPPACPCSSDG